MSNPLALFRKYQRILLVVFGCALMFVFTIGSLVSGYISRGGTERGGADAVVSFSGGKLNERDLGYMRQQRRLMYSYLQNITFQSIQRGGPAQPFYLYVPGTSNEESLLQTKLLSDEAKKLGMTMTREEVLEFLDSLSGNTIKRSEMENMLKNMTQGQVSSNQFLDSLRDQLLSVRYQGLVAQGLSSVSPSAYWDYYQRLNRRVEVEAVPYPVSSFLGQVGAPTSAEIQETYDLGKDKFYSPASPVAGFKVREKVAIGYIKADMGPMLEAAKANVSAEEVQKYYDENKEKFRNASDDEQATTDEATDDATPDDGDSSTEESSDNADGSVESDRADGSEGSDGSGCGPQEETDDATAESDDATAETDDATAETDDATADVDDVPEKTEDAAAVGADTAETANEESTADATLPDIDSVERPADPLNDAAESDLDALTDDEDAATESKPEYMSLEEVEDQIRLLIARRTVSDDFNGKIGQALGEMNPFFGQHVAWSADPKSSDEPTPPGLNAIAAKYGFIAGSVPLVDFVELTQTDQSTKKPIYEIGSSFEIDPSDGRRTSIASIVYSNDLRLYEARKIGGSVSDTQFLFWKTQHVESKNRTLDECRSEVETAVKMKKALTLAKAKAEEDAKKLRSSGKTFADYFGNIPNQTVIETGQFSWMTQGFATDGRIRQSSVPGVEYPGNEFMKSVFSLKEGETGVAVNLPETTVYLTHLKADQSNSEGLKKAFTLTGITRELEQIQLSESNRRLQEWYEDFQTEHKVVWERSPALDTDR